MDYVAQPPHDNGLPTTSHHNELLHEERYQIFLIYFTLAEICRVTTRLGWMTYKAIIECTCWKVLLLCKDLLSVKLDGNWKRIKLK